MIRKKEKERIHMKTVYIPKGETVCYESLDTENLVVKGFLKVNGDVRAKTISGCGSICAGTVGADVIRIDSLEAASVVCARLIAKRVEAPEVFASESAVVSCFLASSYVETGKLTVAVSEVDEVKADEVIHLSRKKRSLFGTLLASALRSFWTGLTAPKARSEILDAEYVQAPTDVPNVMEAEADSLTAEAVPEDEELNRFIAMFKLLRQSGCTLKVIPGTPEENAPVFDFDQERIIRPAA